MYQSTTGARQIKLRITSLRLALSPSFYSRFSTFVNVNFLTYRILDALSSSEKCSPAGLRAPPDGFGNCLS